MYLPQYVNNSRSTLVDMFYIEQPIIMINTLDCDILSYGKTKQCGSLHKKSCLSIWSSDFNSTNAHNDCGGNGGPCDGHGVLNIETH